jgi:hypothetical protein
VRLYDKLKQVLNLTPHFRSEYSTIWPAVVAELSSQGDNSTLEKALKVISQRLKSPQVNSNCLPIYKWSQMILDTPPDHPIQPILAQKFFSYFLARPSPGQAGVGKKFFEGIVNSLYFGRLQTKLKSISDHLNESGTDENPTGQIFVAFQAWCQCYKTFFFESSVTKRQNMRFGQGKRSSLSVLT